jgi:hypothetical protein
MAKTPQKSPSENQRKMTLWHLEKTEATFLLFCKTLEGAVLIAVFRKTNVRMNGCSTKAFQADVK